MAERTHALVQLMFGKASLEECSLHEIEHLTRRYPYFAPAHFLLLQKLKQENSEAYQQQLQRSLLYYHDPLQFDYFINSDKFYIDASELETSVDIAEEKTISEGADATEFKQEVHKEEEEENQIADATELEQKVHRNEEENKGEDEEFEQKVHHNKDEISTPASEAVADEIMEQQNTTPQLPTLNSEVKEPKPATQNDLVFEPYHTVDYFASQGIKPSQEAPKDKFGKQLKSFTEWLKTMKRLPPADLPQNTDTAGEKTVVNLATHSVDETDVVTEAMAEVWLKQGNTEKAIEIYNKLSLQNPSKKAFFAAKIDNLKHS